MKLIEDMKIVKNIEIAKNIFEMTLTGNNINLMNEPGQFINIKITEMSQLILRRPISICEIDQEKKQLKLIYRIEGEGTKTLAKKLPGEFINIFGPLGNGYPEFSIKNHETALLVGGGVGVPPLYELAKRLSKRNIKVISVLGFATMNGVFYEKEFSDYSEVHVATIDGSYKFKGNVVELIKFKNLQFDVIYGCGPRSMLKAISNEYINLKRGYLSIEERMACGIGACYACVCDKANNLVENVRICKEGPVFKLGEVKI